MNWVYMRDCFREDFQMWLIKSNNPNIVPCKSEEEFNLMLDKAERESLREILDVLLREPLADYFWYGYPEHDGKLSYWTPSNGDGPVPGDSIRVDKEKIKVFLRDYKINSILMS